MIYGANDFQMRLFLPIDPGAGRPAVVCFRGTEPTRAADLMTDANPAGVGMDQYLLNVGVIDGAMRRAMALSGGKVVVSGHSLGGALAQIAASWHPDRVQRIVTFQAPGVNESRMQALVDFNRSAAPEDRITSTHYRVLGDVVPMAGEAMTPGEIHTFIRGGSAGDQLTNHMAFPVTAAAGQNGRAGLSGQTTSPFTAMATTGTDGDLTARRSGRALAGMNPLARAGMAGGNAAEAIYDRYNEYWMQVSVAVDRGMSRRQVEAMIRGWSLWFGMEDLMLQQLGELYRTRDTTTSSTGGHTSDTIELTF